MPCITFDLKPEFELTRFMEMLEMKSVLTLLLSRRNYNHKPAARGGIQISFFTKLCLAYRYEDCN